MNEIMTIVSNIEEIIDSINFKKVYRFFEKQKIAIYYDGFLYFSDNKTPFNNSIRDSIDDSKDLAILNYESLVEDNLLNAGLFVKAMVLNMFYKRHDRRIPNDLIALQYPNIYLNYDYMQYERKLLIKAYHSQDNYVKLNFFRMFLNVRDLRRQMIGNEFSMLEYGLETIIGLSDYAMYKAISLIDKKMMKNYIKELAANFNLNTEEHFDFRHANFNSGLFLVLLMHELQIDIEILFESDQTLYQAVSQKIQFIREPVAYKSDKGLLEKLTQYEEQVSEKFAMFFENEPKRVTGYFQIFAYDPERIFVDKDKLYHESFVILKNLLNNDLIKLEGPVVTKILDNSYDIVTSYHYFVDSKQKRVRKKGKKR